MLYSITEYKQEFHPFKSIRTVRRMVRSNLLPIGHEAVRVSNRIVFIETSPNAIYEPYLKAIRAYNRTKGLTVDVELSVKLGIENNVDSIKLLNEILGL